MILCKNRKLGVFLNPRAGSNTIVEYFSDNLLIEAQHDHVSYPGLQLPDKESYQFYSFYRDPVDRFISALSLYRPKPVSVREFLSSFRDWDTNPTFAPQHRWLNYDNVTPLSFDHIENELTKLAFIFGIEPRPLKHLHMSKKRIVLDNDEIACVKKIYADDYALFG